MYRIAGIIWINQTTMSSLPRVEKTWQIEQKELKNEIQLDATYYFIMLMLGSTCFGHHYVHHQELTTIAFVTT